MIREETAGKAGRKTARLLLAAGIAVCALPALAVERQVIPFDVNDEEHMVVSIDVNGGGTVEGIIDTAATFPMIDAHTARIAGLPEMEEDPVMVNVLGVTGPEIYPVVQLDSLMVGNILKTDVRVALNRNLDVPGASNVLPASAFEGDIVDFDFQNRSISFYNGLPDRRIRLVASRLRLEEVDGLYFTDVRINGHKGRALIDTGSSVTFINSNFAIGSGTATNEEKTITLQGATGGNQSLRIASARLMQIGDYRVSKVDILVANPPLFEYLNLQDQPSMVLGLDLLSSFRVQLDRRRGYLYLSLPEEEGVTLNTNARDTRIGAF